MMMRMKMNLWKKRKMVKMKMERMNQRHEGRRESMRMVKATKVGGQQEVISTVMLSDQTDRAQCAQACLQC